MGKGCSSFVELLHYSSIPLLLFANMVSLNYFHAVETIISVQFTTTTTTLLGFLGFITHGHVSGLLMMFC